MKILWISNTIFPAPDKKFGLPTSVFCGWMYSLAKDLSKDLNIELAVANVYKGRDLKIFNYQVIQYFLLPSKNMLNYQKELEDYWNEVCNLFEPNIINIHGTEYPHGLACMIKRPDFRRNVKCRNINEYYYH